MTGENRTPSGPSTFGPSNEEARKKLAEVAARYVISPQLFKQFDVQTKRDRNPEPRLWQIIEVNLDDRGGRSDAHERVTEKLQALEARVPAMRMKPPQSSRHHLFAYLTKREIIELVKEDNGDEETKEGAPAIYKVWYDRPLDAYMDRSVRIIKADASLRLFDADGRDIVWAVADSGIQGDHPHFKLYQNLVPPRTGSAPARSGRTTNASPLDHQDFTDDAGGDALVDEFGHGTHVAAIIAGVSPHAWDAARPGLSQEEAKRLPPTPKVLRVTRRRDADDCVRSVVETCERRLQGVAPRTALISLKVLNKDGEGQESSLLSAIDYISRVNDNGKWPRIHGLNLSLGYSFEAEWFAAGQSPLCVAVNRLVREGVAVVAAAGNDGSALIATENSPAGRRVGLDQSVTDPGNAELAITVGSTHPEQPHTYGVSYFSSRGPTADGRDKPDLIAPGERIVSAASPGALKRAEALDPLLEHEGTLEDASAAYYREESGTSMAAPHVSGAIAAFLSVNREFIPEPLRVKKYLIDNATDLGRRKDFQGAGLLDLLRAMEDV